jgi:glutathione synthase/RimK-type ligase-like ATP-grasp enzyme
VSHPDLVRRSSHRPLQLARANVLGFRVPLTLVTSNPSEVRSFVERFDGPTVVKPIDANWVYSSAESSVIRALASSIGGPGVGDEPGARPTPLMVQEEIESAYEVRVHVVGQRMLAVKIEGQPLTGPVGTWGQNGPPRERCTPYNLPGGVERRCAELARSFGLELAAIDLIRSRDGEYVFVEIDGSPDFLWLEDRSGVPVSAALADLLAGTVPSRRPADRSRRPCRRASPR